MSLMVIHRLPRHCFLFWKEMDEEDEDVNVFRRIGCGNIAIFDIGFNIIFGRVHLAITTELVIK